jgi:hypothetical protein
MLQVRVERQRRGKSLTWLSGVTGIAACDLSQIERGLRPAFPGWRRRVARAFGLPADKLFAEVEEPR